MTREGLAPVVVFAYNRPVHLTRTLDALAGSRLSDRTDVHVFADGPRNAGAVQAVSQVREVLAHEAAAGRFASFVVHASDVNAGLAASIIRGVSRVLADRGSVVVLEDDLIVSADFLEFMNDCLVYYRDDPSVGTVTGFCPLLALPAGYDKDVFLARRNSSQGWGTWARVWESVDWSAAGMGLLCSSRKLRHAFNAEGSDRFDRLRRQMAGRIDSWSIRFGLSLFLRGLGTVYPAVNRIGNIGYDGSGIHSGVGTPKNDEIRESPYTLVPVEIDARIQRDFRRTYSGNLPGRAIREALTLFPRVAEWFGR